MYKSVILNQTRMLNKHTNIRAILSNFMPVNNGSASRFYRIYVSCSDNSRLTDLCAVCHKSTNLFNRSTFLRREVLLNFSGL